jgi:hypothetical protein
MLQRVVTLLKQFKLFKMKNQSAVNNPSTLQEWASFFTVLNANKNSDKPLLKKAESPSRLITHLEKEFSKVQQQPIFRRLGKHRQLSLNFS